MESMLDQRPAPPEPSTAPPSSDARSGEAIDVVALFNDDHWEGHSVTVDVAVADCETVLRERRYLPPDQSVLLTGAIDPGVYRLRVWVDGVERSRVERRLDGTATGTAAVELGNGTVSVTTGATDPLRSDD